MPDNNIQDMFLNAIREDKKETTIFLSNGVKLQGMITWFDNFSILLSRGENVQLVYKHSIATVLPQGKIKLTNPEVE